MIRSVEHIGIAVRSIEEARGFYESLGLAIEHIEEVPEEGVRVAFVPCGHTRLELLEPTRPDSPVAKFLEKRGPGIHHLCLESDAIDEDDARLRGSGMELLRQRPTIGAGGAGSVRAPSRAEASCSSCLSRARNQPTVERRGPERGMIESEAWFCSLSSPPEQFWGVLEDLRGRYHLPRPQRQLRRFPGAGGDWRRVLSASDHLRADVPSSGST
jgi:methylmalonyl-CoA epimerase